MNQSGSNAHRCSSESVHLKYLHIIEGVPSSGHATFGGSISDYLASYRAAVTLIKSAEEQGTLKPGMEIVGPAWGSCSVAIASIAADRGYDLILTAPESIGSEQKNLLSELGAHLVFTPATSGERGAISRAEELASAEPGRRFLPHIYQMPDGTPRYGTPRYGTTDDGGIPSYPHGTITVSLSEAAAEGPASGVSHYTSHIRGRQSC